MKTQRVRILVAIDSGGGWTSYGDRDNTDEDNYDGIPLDCLNDLIRYHWIEADVPISVTEIIEATSVTPAPNREDA